MARRRIYSSLSAGERSALRRYRRRTEKRHRGGGLLGRFRKKAPDAGPTPIFGTSNVRLHLSATQVQREPRPEKGDRWNRLQLIVIGIVSIVFLSWIALNVLTFSSSPVSTWTPENISSTQVTLKGYLNVLPPSVVKVRVGFLITTDPNFVTGVTNITAGTNLTLPAVFLNVHGVAGGDVGKHFYVKAWACSATCGAGTRIWYGSVLRYVPTDMKFGDAWTAFSNALGMFPDDIGLLVAVIVIVVLVIVIARLTGLDSFLLFVIALVLMGLFSWVGIFPLWLFIFIFVCALAYIVLIGAGAINVRSGPSAALTPSNRAFRRGQRTHERYLRENR